MAEKFANAAQGRLAVGVSSSATSWLLDDASPFLPDEPGTFSALCEAEFVTVTGIVGNTLIVTRNEDGGAASHAADSVVTLVVTSRVLRKFSQAYTHDQTSASTTWTISHPLNRKPSVTIVDSGGTTVFGEIVYVSDSQITITFSAAFAGKAHLS